MAEQAAKMAFIQAYQLMPKQADMIVSVQGKQMIEMATRINSVQGKQLITR